MDIIDPKNNIREVPIAHSDTLLTAALIAMTTPQPFYAIHAVVNDIEKYLIEQKLIRKAK